MLFRKKIFEQSPFSTAGTMAAMGAITRQGIQAVARSRSKCLQASWYAWLAPPCLAFAGPAEWSRFRATPLFSIKAAFPLCRARHALIGRRPSSWFPSGIQLSVESARIPDGPGQKMCSRSRNLLAEVNAGGVRKTASVRLSFSLHGPVPLHLPLRALPPAARQTDLRHPPGFPNERSFRRICPDARITPYLHPSPEVLDPTIPPDRPCGAGEVLGCSRPTFSQASPYRHNSNPEDFVSCTTRSRRPQAPSWLPAGGVTSVGSVRNPGTRRASVLNPKR